MLGLQVRPMIDDSALLPFLLLLPIFDWMVTGALIALAFQRPRIPFLTERAVVGFVVAVVTTAYAGVALNGEQDHAWFNVETAVVVVRLLVIALAATPILWIVNFWRRRDGETAAVREAALGRFDNPYPGSDH